VEAAKILADAAMETEVIRAVTQYLSGHRGRCSLSLLGIYVQDSLSNKPSDRFYQSK
jgi:hypothetical protein